MTHQDLYTLRCRRAKEFGIPSDLIQRMVDKTFMTEEEYQDEYGTGTFYPAETDTMEAYDETVG